MPEFLSSSEVANIFGTDLWRVQRLFESGALPEPPRIAGRRAIPRAMLTAILDALRARDWVATPAEAIQ
jgi:hypothetical protein